MRLAFVLVLAGLTLAACGGGDTSSLAAAATKSSKVSTMKMDMSMSMTIPGLAGPVAMTASGGLDNVNHRDAMTLDMSAFAAAAGGKLGDPSLWKGEEIGDFSNGHLVLYMKLPFVTRALPGSKPWLKLDLAQYSKKLGVDFSAITQFTSDPSQMLGWLRATSGKIETVGKETVDGVETTHYRAIVDLSKYPNVLPPERRAAARQAIAQVIKLTGVHTYPADAWVGSDGLIRKMRLALTESLRGQQLQMKLDMRYHDFNAPVNVTIPPESQTTDLATLSGGNP